MSFGDKSSFFEMLIYELHSYFMYNIIVYIFKYVFHDVI